MAVRRLSKLRNDRVRALHVAPATVSALAAASSSLAGHLPAMLENSGALAGPLLADGCRRVR